MEKTALSWERDWPAAALALAALILAAPLWCVSVPAMPDYPAHLASFWLIGGGAADPIVAKAYFLRWSFIPNLAAEIVVPALARLVGLDAAAKLLLTAGVMFWVLGPGAVQRALFGRWSIAPLLGAFFAYNANFSWGFCNYYFASGLGFFIFAAWIGLRRKTPLRLCAFALAVTVLYFCHIFAAATLFLMITAYEATLAWREDRGDIAALWTRGLAVVAVYAPAALAFLFLKPANTGDTRLEFNFADTALDRFESLIEYNFDTPSYALPILLFACLAAALLLRKARLHPAMPGVLAVLLAASLVAPEWAMGGWAVHMRLPGVFAAMLFAGTEFHLGKYATRVLAGATLAIMGWLAMELTADWRSYNRQYAEFRAAESAIPRGARLVTVLDGDAIGMESDQPYWHLGEFALMDRGAFTPLMFTTPGQHVVQLRPPYRPLAAATAQQGSPPDIDELPSLAAGAVEDDPDIRDVFPYLMRFQCHFDQALVVHLGGRRSQVPAMLRLVHAGSFFSLYDIVPDAACAKS